MWRSERRRVRLALVRLCCGWSGLWLVLSRLVLALTRACACVCVRRVRPGSTRAVAWLNVGDLCLHLDAGV